MLTGDPAAELVPLREVVTGRPSVDMARFVRPDSPGHFRGIFSFLDADGRNCGAVSCTIDGEEVRTGYVPKVATDICGLAKGRDGRIYGSTIISMNVSKRFACTTVVAAPFRRVSTNRLAVMVRTGLLLRPGHQGYDGPWESRLAGGRGVQRGCRGGRTALPGHL